MLDPNDPARPTARQQAGNRRIALAAGATVLGMVGLSFAAVPLYAAFCRVTGYNGFPRGVTDLPERLADRPTKLLLSVHAEANAVATAARSGVPLAGCTAYITHPPCAACAASLIQSGIRRVVFQGQLRADWADSEAAGRLLMDEAGVAWQRGTTTEA